MRLGTYIRVLDHLCEAGRPLTAEGRVSEAAQKHTRATAAVPEAATAGTQAPDDGAIIDSDGANADRRDSQRLGHVADAIDRS